VTTLRRLGEHAERRRLGAGAELRSAALTGEAELGRLRGPNEPRRWADATAAWRRTGFPLPAAYCGWRHAEAVLAGGGSRDEAVELYAAAGTLATELGALPLTAAIEQSARRARVPSVAGVRDEPVARIEGDFGITARELEVLELLARGWTNKQVAEALFISEKTARVHVSHLLAKLGVPTRGAAVDVAHRHGLLDRPR
jgi:DNA-binding CsgD family transcriptional regulator